MTIQSEIYLGATGFGFYFMGMREKSTVFSKTNLSEELASPLRTAIRTDDNELLTTIVALLMAAADEGGWGNAPGAYMMKHLGYMFGMGLFTPDGEKSDITLTVRTSSSLR